MKNNAISAIGKKIKLSNGNQVIVITKTIEGYYDEEKGVFIDTKKGITYQDVYGNSNTCFMNTMYIEEIEKLGITKEEYKESIDNIFYLATEIDGLINLQGFEGNNLETENKDVEETKNFVDNIDVIYDNILSGEYSIEELEDFQETLYEIEAIVETLQEAINEQIRKPRLLN